MICKCKLFNADEFIFFFAGNTSRTDSLYTRLHLKAHVYNCGMEGKKPGWEQTDESRSLLPCPNPPVQEQNQSDFVKSV